MNMKVFLLVACLVASIQMTSGMGAIKEAGPLIQALIDDMKSEILEPTGKSSTSAVSEFTAVSYSREWPDYFVKIKVGSNNYIHARIYVVPKGNKKHVVAVQTGKAWEDPTEYIYKE